MSGKFINLRNPYIFAEHLLTCLTVNSPVLALRNQDRAVQSENIRQLIAGCILLSVFSSGCGTVFRTPLEKANEILAGKGFEFVLFKSERFDLVGFVKNRGGSEDTLVVYIEGDGFAWKNRSTVSDDPTPKNLLVLQLAALDAGAKVCYLGRPCQFVGGDLSGCNRKYWTTHRYSEEVIAAADEAISRIRETVGADKIGLIGYSGGGSLAALIAARRTDTAWLATIAANLDHSAWTSYHDVTPLSGSLNPADVTQNLQSVPQIHFVGGKDDNVPEFIVKSYLKRMTDPSRTKIVVLSEYTHDCCWVQGWTRLQKQITVLKQERRQYGH